MQKDGEYVVALRGIHVDDLIGSALQGYEDTLNQVASSFT